MTKKYLILLLLCMGIAEAKWYLGIETGYTAVIDQYQSKTIGQNKTQFVMPLTSSYGNAFKTTSWRDKGISYTKHPYFGPNVNLYFGSEHFGLKNHLGIRWGLGLGYTTYSNNTEIETKLIWGKFIGEIVDKFEYLDTIFKLDMIINILTDRRYSLGIFGGSELSYHYLINRSYFNTFDKTKTNATNQSHSIDLNGRVGLTAMFAKHYRLDFIFKLPIGSIISGDEGKMDLLPAFPTLNFNVGYTYIF